MKKIFLFAVVAGLSVSLSAQSLVDLAKKEKERREALKGRSAVVIRNADLKAVKKVPAVEISGAEEAAAGEAPPAEPAAVTGATIPEGTQIVPRVAADGPPLMAGSGSANTSASSAKALESQLRAAEDQVDLLTTKMAALRQQFEAQNAMTPGYVIQQQLEETNLRLLKAQAQLDRIRQDMERKKTGLKPRPDEIER